ncbi:MAG TPA: ATP-dependent DNA ligase [Actinomycetota bacterium]|nr:ATP-dependent DNA ligase [Actinomycetota bacterium]
MLPYPIAPQLCRLQDRLPQSGGWLYEPKWDGFRCLLFKQGRTVRLQSRNGKDLGGSFPEIMGAATGLPDCVLDGELIAIRDGRQDFESLLGRLAGDGREEVSMILFDALACGGADLRPVPFSERRSALEGLPPSPFLQATPQTDDPAVADTWLHQSFELGFEGVVAKKPLLSYRSGDRCMVKVKHFESVDVVVGGYTGTPGDARALILGLYDGDGTLHHVGTTSVLPALLRAQVNELKPTANHFNGQQPGRSRWASAQFDEWVAVEPTAVCEIEFNRLDGMKFRHSVRLLRFRPDLDPSGCTYEQLRRFGAGRSIPAPDGPLAGR